jgi:hypothetical protein
MRLNFHARNLRDVDAAGWLAQGLPIAKALLGPCFMCPRKRVSQG